MTGVKRAFDVCGALGGLLFFGPLMLCVAAAILADDGRPVLFRQSRLGRGRRAFEIVKFRSMRDGRVTRAGRVLRATGLDELPQFLNVLKGEMSIVGPRPERPAFIEGFRDQIPGYMQKHLVKAGITGWAQVNDLRGNTDLGKRIEYDLFYIENWSVWFDLRIILLTAWQVVRSRNAY